MHSFRTNTFRFSFSLQCFDSWLSGPVYLYLVWTEGRLILGSQLQRFESVVVLGAVLKETQVGGEQTCSFHGSLISFRKTKTSKALLSPRPGAMSAKEPAVASPVDTLGHLIS